MAARTRPGTPGRYKAIALAVAVHAAVIAVLLVSFRWGGGPVPPPERVIQATAVRETPPAAPREQEAERRRAEVEAAKKRAEAERKRREAEEAAKRRAEAQRREREAQAAKQRAEAERRRREAEEAERKRVEAERRRQDAEQALQRSLAAEERAREQAAAAARARSEAEKYRALIIQKVSRNWSEPPGSKGLQCVLSVRVVPGGEIVSVRVVQSSGNAVFDSSVQNAVYKSTPLPLPADPALFEHLREIEFTFRPPAG